MQIGQAGVKHIVSKVGVRVAVHIFCASASIKDGYFLMSRTLEDVYRDCGIFYATVI